VGKPNFTFAGIAAAFLAAATVVLAVSYHLPIRDPDGVVVPTYVRLPIILLLAFLIDVVPRAVGRYWRSPRSLARGCAEVARERWGWSHVVFAVSGLGVWYLSYAAFRNLKSYVPFVNDHLWDNTLASYDRMLWLGHDPATVLQDIFGTGRAAEFFSLVYVAWIVLVPVTLAVALMWTRHVSAGSWYVTAVTLDWVLGVATYFLVPTVGPIYSAPQNFAALPHTYVAGLEQSMMDDRLRVLADPFATDAVQTIAAFASLHVGIMVTICLIAHFIGLPRWLQACGWLFLALTELSTIYLGWHFFLDTVGGVVLGAAAVWIAALGTGNHVGGRPALVVSADAPAERTDQASASRSRSA
jgi:hypothetical protein